MQAVLKFVPLSVQHLCTGEVALHNFAVYCSAEGNHMLEPADGVAVAFAAVVAYRVAVAACHIACMPGSGTLVEWGTAVQGTDPSDKILYEKQDCIFNMYSWEIKFMLGREGRV